MDDIPQGLPASSRAQKIQKRAASVGFDWPNCDLVFEKLQEELGELSVALDTGEKSQIEEEVGDLMFTVVNIARHVGVDAESALRRCNHKFTARFKDMETESEAQGEALAELSLEQLNALWTKAKKP